MHQMPSAEELSSTHLFAENNIFKSIRIKFHRKYNRKYISLYLTCQRYYSRAFHERKRRVPSIVTE